MWWEISQLVSEMFHLFLSLQINRTLGLRALWYMKTDPLNTFSFEDILESLVSIEIGSGFVIEGRWFDSYEYKKFHH